MKIILKLVYYNEFNGDIIIIVNCIVFLLSKIQISVLYKS